MRKQRTKLLWTPVKITRTILSISSLFAIVPIVFFIMYLFASNEKDNLSGVVNSPKDIPTLLQKSKFTLEKIYNIQDSKITGFNKNFILFKTLKWTKISMILFLLASIADLVLCSLQVVRSQVKKGWLIVPALSALLSLTIIIIAFIISGWFTKYITAYNGDDDAKIKAVLDKLYLSDYNYEPVNSVLEKNTVEPFLYFQNTGDQISMFENSSKTIVSLLALVAFSMSMCLFIISLTYSGIFWHIIYFFI